MKPRKNETQRDYERRVEDARRRFPASGDKHFKRKETRTMSFKRKTGYTPKEFAHFIAIAALENTGSFDEWINDRPIVAFRIELTEKEVEQIGVQVDKLLDRLHRAVGASR